MSTTLQQTAFNEARSEAFSEKMIGILNAGGITLMVSIGHRTGLFDTMATLPPSTSDEIANAAGLNERYVREWLGAMVTGGIVEYDSQGKTYALPAEHAAWLTRSASPNNLAVTTQFFSVLGAVEDGIVDCFRNGGGLPYTAFPRFHEVMAEESAQTVVAALFDGILPLAPGLIEALEKGINVLDVGCGSGRAMVALGRTFPRSRFHGYDISPEAVARARAEAERAGVSNVEFSQQDVATIEGGERFDLITAFDAIHDQARPDLVLAGIARALRDNGTFLMQDIAGSSHVHKNLRHPIAPLLYTISCMHCMTVSLADGGAGLGTLWGQERALEMLEEAGFQRIEVRTLPHDFMNCFYIAKKR